MATLRQLYDIIHALDRNERKHLSLTIGGMGGKAKGRYTKSLSIIHADKTFDADKLKKKLSANLMGMNLSEANTNFYGFICKTLIAYHNFGIGNLGLHKELMLIEILTNKGLFDSAHKTLQPIIERLKSGGSFSMLHRAYELQSTINIHYRKLSIDYKSRYLFFAERIKAVDEHRLYLEIVLMNTKFQEVVQKVGEPRSKAQEQPYRELYKSPLFKLPLSSVTSRGLNFYLPLKISLKQMFEGERSAYSECTAAIENFRKRFKGNELYSSELYIVDIVMVIAISMNDYEVIQKAKSDLFRLHGHLNQKGPRQKIQARLMMADLNVCIGNKDFVTGEKMLKEWMSEKKKPLWIEANLSYINLLLAARLLYLSGKPDKALDYLQMLQDKEKTMRPSVLISYRFLFLLCHYRLRNYQFLTHATEQLYRTLLKLDKIYSPERALLQFVKKCSDFDKVKPELKKLSATLTSLSKDPYNKSFFGFGDYLEWIKIETKKE